MKVLQTLGAHAGGQVGIFQYCRTSEGVYVDPTVGFSSADEFTVSHDDWVDLLAYLGGLGYSTFDLSELRDEISDYLTIGSSEAAAIVAILEHEGSFDHYGGVRGGGVSAAIILRRDY
ncbi:hypothetical protein [Pectobacterium carotovorum]|uniref:hypothetical protein n=1 Tax=Pectobacterium carotovorum TaxID=554 RepID=UPI0013741940|nr:hypothetical protein [Pectobacterium carotovorum]MBL0906731.1 hypothetical protein [Pectobacterium carotovorum]QHP58117.1 hypothetical protein EH204_09130 [Pectobacterium carotovorum subsp. carotovorum]